MYFELQILNHNRLRFPKMYPISISARVDPGWVSKRSSLEVLPQQSVLVSISYQESCNRQTWNCHKEQHKVSVSYECSSACHVMDPTTYLFWLNGTARRRLNKTVSWISWIFLWQRLPSYPLPREQECLLQRMFWALSTIQPFTFTFTLGAQDQQQLGEGGGEPGGQAGGGHHQTGKRDPAWSQENLTF